MAQKTPHVQLVLNVNEGPVQQQEIVKQVTGKHEVVEVNGFTFKRQRTATPAPPSENQQPNNGTPRTAQLSQAAAASQMLTAPCAGAPAAGQLASLCSSVCGQEAAATGNEALAAALAYISAAFGVEVAQAAQAAHIRAAPVQQQLQLMPQWQEAAPSHVDLAARKAGLRARLAALEKEEAEWQALLNKVGQLDLEAVGNEPGQDGAAANESSTAVSEQGGSADPLPAEVLALERLRRDVHCFLAMQVEGMCLLVGDMEELVERASRSAQAVQAGYHEQKFQAFSHVDSPAHLIKLITRQPEQEAGAA